MNDYSNDGQTGSGAKVTTESGSVYEFVWDKESPSSNLRWGTVSQNGAQSMYCAMLSYIMVGQIMVLALGTGMDSPTLKTSRVASFEVTR